MSRFEHHVRRCRKQLLNGMYFTRFQTIDGALNGGRGLNISTGINFLSNNADAGEIDSDVISVFII